MFKVICLMLLKLFMIFVVAGLLNWLYGFFSESSFFIFLIIVISSIGYSEQQKKIQSLHERLLKTEGFNR